MSNYLEKIIAKIRPRCYSLLSFASLYIFIHSISFPVRIPEPFGLLVTHDNIESRLDSLNNLYNQPVNIKNLVDVNYFKRLEELNNNLLSQKGSIESSYIYSELKIEYDLQVKEYDKSESKADWILGGSFVVFILSTMSGISSWKDRYRALESEKLKEKSQANK
jgi:hypothetical protein